MGRRKKGGGKAASFLPYERKRHEKGRKTVWKGGLKLGLKVHGGRGKKKGGGRGQRKIIFLIRPEHEIRAKGETERGRSSRIHPQNPHQKQQKKKKKKKKTKLNPLLFSVSST